MENAVWIWPESLGNDNAYAVFEDMFAAGDGPVFSKIASSGEYALYINGKIAGFGQYPDWEGACTENIHDISALCKPGENAFRLIAWNPGIDTQMSVAREGRVKFSVFEGAKTLLASGQDTPCAPHGQYKTGKVPLITFQLGYSFEYDANAPDLPLGRAKVLSDMPVRLRPIPLLKRSPLHRARLCASGAYFETDIGSPAHRMQTAALSCGNTALEKADGQYLIYDLLEEKCGYFTLAATFTEACEVLISFGEHLDDLRVRAEVGGRNFCAVYHAKPGYNDFEHCLRRWGCRYIQLHIPDKDAKVHAAGLREVEYPLPEARPLPMDSLHEGILSMCARTLKNCLHDHYEDCPWREQALYAMDSRIQMLCGYYTFGETCAPFASLKLLAEGIRDDDLLPICAPSDVPFTIPCFSLAFVVALWEYLLHSGDAPGAWALSNTALRILNAFEKNTDPLGRVLAFKGPRYWNFYEWNDGLSGHIPAGDETAAEPDSPEGILTAWYACALSAMEKLYAHMDMEEAAALMRERYGRAAKALETFWDEEKELYSAKENGVYAEIMQALVLLSGACPEDRTAALRRTLSGENDLIPVSLSNKLLVYQALMQQEETYADFVFDDIAAVWGRMLTSGATTCWETELGANDFDRAGSLCHGWSAVPAYFYYAYGLGVRPDEPGVYAPHPVFQTKLRIPR